jgi:hypothetical protein
MRPITNANRYTPGEPPMLSGESQELVRFLMQELWKLSSLANLVAEGQLEISHAAPDKPRTGMLRVADGTQWNPGSGRGLYWYDEGTASWKFIA